MIEGAFGFLLGPERQLFVDEMLVETAENAARTLHRPEKHPDNPLLSATEEEQRMVCLHGTVLYDPKDKLFKAWYLSRRGMRYAFSEDGIRWQRPKGGNLVYPVNREKPHLHETTTVDCFSVMIDAGEDNPETRYKAFSFEARKEADSPAQRDTFMPAAGYYTAVSSDGLDWKTGYAPVISKKDDPILGDANTCMWDDLKKRYIAFTKRMLNNPRTIGDAGTRLRVRGISFSDDFINWTVPRTCLVPDDQDSRDLHFYNQSGWVYEGLYIGLLETYYADYKNPRMPMRRDIQLVSSRDGELWSRAGNRETFIPLGEGDGWDSRMLDLNSAGPELVDDTLWIYYGGRNYPHDSHPELFPSERPGEYAIGLAKLRRDGYISYDGGETPGFVLTKPIRFEKGGSLYVNASAAGGSMGVEVLEVIETDSHPERPSRGIKYKMGEPLQGYGVDESVRISEDKTRIKVSWKGGDTLPKGDSWIALKFTLQNASLYAFWSE